MKPSELAWRDGSYERKRVSDGEQRAERNIWSWSPGRWSKDYTVENGVMLVDTAGMTGFLIGVFEKGYVISDVNNWDSNVLKQSSDVKGEVLAAGFVDMTGF